MTFAELIDPIRSEKVLESVATSSATIAKWRRGESLPNGWQIWPLAKLLRVEAGELARIIFNDATGGGRLMPSSLRLVIA